MTFPTDLEHRYRITWTAGFEAAPDDGEGPPRPIVSIAHIDLDRNDKDHSAHDLNVWCERHGLKWNDLDTVAIEARTFVGGEWSEWKTATTINLLDLR